MTLPTCIFEWNMSRGKSKIQNIVDQEFDLSNLRGFSELVQSTERNTRLGHKIFKN